MPSTLNNWKDLHWVSMTTKQKESCPRISIGYTDQWDRRVAVRTIPDCLGAEEKVVQIEADLKDQGKTGIWHEPWSPYR